MMLLDAIAAVGRGERRQSPTGAAPRARWRSGTEARGRVEREADEDLAVEFAEEVQGRTRDVRVPVAQPELEERLQAFGAQTLGKLGGCALIRQQLRKGGRAR